MVNSAIVLYLLSLVFTIITLLTLSRWVFFILVHYVYMCLILFVIIITEWIWPSFQHTSLTPIYHQQFAIHYHLDSNHLWDYFHLLETVSAWLDFQKILHMKEERHNWFSFNWQVPFPLSTTDTHERFISCLVDIWCVVAVQWTYKWRNCLNIHLVRCEWS